VDRAARAGCVAPAVVEQLWGALDTAMQNLAVRDVLLRDGSDIVVSKPQEFRRVIERDYAKYGKLADLLKAASK